MKPPTVPPLPKPHAVVDEHYVLPNGNRVQADCHHREGAACAGCYARLHFALLQVERHLKRHDIIGALALIGAVNDARRAEVKK